MRWFRPVSTLSIAALAVAASAHVLDDLNARVPDTHIRLKIELRSGQDALLAGIQLSPGVGPIIQADGRTVTLRLQDAERLEDVLKQLEGRRSVAKVHVLAPLFPTTEWRKYGYDLLKTTVDRYKVNYLAYREWAEERGLIEEEKSDDPNAPQEELELPGLDFLEGYLQYLQLRAYPNNRIDLNVYTRFAEERWLASQSGGVQVDPAVSRGQIRRVGSGGETITSQAQWEYLGPNDMDAPYRIYFGLGPCSGRVNAVAVHPTDANTVYIGGAQGGAWVTNDGGVNWRPLGDNWPLMGVSSILIHPSDPNLILVGTGDFHGYDVAGIGIMRSTDGGQTWSRVATGIGGGAVSELEVWPDNPDVIIATSGRTGTNGVWRSTDRGATWTQVVNTNVPWSDLAVSAPNPSGPRSIWAVAGGNPGRVLRSDNGGQTWNTITVPLMTGNQNPLAIAASKLNPGTVYVLSTTQRQIWKTTDNGATWTNSTNNFPNGSNNYNWSQGWYDFHIHTSTRTVNNVSSDVVYVGLIDVMMSIDGGATWRNIGGTNFAPSYGNSAITHVDQHSLAIDPQNPNVAWVGNDGGIYRFTYNPNTDTYTWDRLSSRLGITQFYTAASHPTNRNYVKGGTQDNSTPASFGNLADWRNPGAGDGAGTAINPVNPNIQYNSSQFQNIYRTSNAYVSETTITPSWTGQSTPFIGKLWLDPNNPRYLYANTNFLNRYDDQANGGAGAWSLQLGGQNFGATVNALDIARGNSNFLVLGTTNGGVWISQNFGTNWTRIDRQGLAGGLPNRAITAVSLDPNDPRIAVIATSGTGAAKVWRTNDVTAATVQWFSVSGGLPDIPANDLVRDIFQPNTVWYLGTDVGVFMTENAGTSWTDITRSRGLPNVQVNDLVTTPGTGDLLAGTFGRGMWRMPLVPARLAGFTANPIRVIGGDNFNATVTLDRPAPAAMSVSFGSSAPASLPSSGAFVVGETAVTVAGSTQEVGSDTARTLTATIVGNQSASSEVTVLATTDRSVFRAPLANVRSVTGTFQSMTGLDGVSYTWLPRAPNRNVSQMAAYFTSPIAAPGFARVEMDVNPDRTVEIEGIVYDANLASGLSLGTQTINAGAQRLRFNLDAAARAKFNARGDIVFIYVVRLPGLAQGDYTMRVDRTRLRVRQNP